MILTGQQRQTLRKGIVGAYPKEDELKILLLEEMELNIEGINRGEDYDTRVFNLIRKLEIDGELKNFIRIIVNQKPNSLYLKEIKSEFKKIIEEDEVEYPPQVSIQRNYLDHRRKLARPVFDVGTSGEIRIIGPKGSGKTTFLCALADWNDLRFRKSLKAVEPLNEHSLGLKESALNVLRNGARLEPTKLGFENPDPNDLPLYLFRLEITPNFWHNPLCWLLKRNIRFSLSCKDFAGEFINELKAPSESNYIHSFLDDCAFSSGLLVMIDATNSLQLDKEYSQAFSTLRRELMSRIKRGGWKVKYKIAVVFSKADQCEIWKYRRRLEEFMSINFPCTQNIFQEWSKDGGCVVAYFACSAFGMRGNPPRPNVINGNCGCLADPIAWQPFGLASAIYWLSTGKVDARLQ